MTKVISKDSTLKPGAVAQLVKRTVTDKEGNSTEVSIKAADVFDWCEYPDEGRIVVVTTAGEKLEGTLKAKA